MNVSTLRITDPCTDHILDFIAGGVPGNMAGESGGNYNAVIDDMHATDDLSVKTLLQIYTLQDQLVGRGRPSSAIGRYQFIKRTLQALAAPLPTDTLFTPSLQDHLAVQLLVGRGYKSWWRDQMDNIHFAHGLSCEWACLPDPFNGGRSHYDGIGANHASTTLSHLYAALATAAALRGGTSKPSK
jgi:muramidase (phage lysozyme)